MNSNKNLIYLIASIIVIAGGVMMLLHIKGGLAMFLIGSTVGSVMRIYETIKNNSNKNSQTP